MKYEQLCKYDSQGSKRFGKKHKRRLIRLASKRIIKLYLKGEELKSEKVVTNPMRGWVY
jgi:hypothetical protein